MRIRRICVYSNELRPSAGVSSSVFGNCFSIVPRPRRGWTWRKRRQGISTLPRLCFVNRNPKSRTVGLNFLHANRNYLRIWVFPHSVGPRAKRSRRHTVQRTVKRTVTSPDGVAGGKTGHRTKSKQKIRHEHFRTLRNDDIAFFTASRVF